MNKKVYYYEWNGGNERRKVYVRQNLFVLARFLRRGNWIREHLEYIWLYIYEVTPKSGKGRKLLLISSNPMPNNDYKYE